MTAPINLILLGTGYSRAHHVPWLKKLAADFRVVGVFSRTEANARIVADELPGAVAVFTDVEQALAMDGVQAVDVALPITVAANAVEAAFERGLHVISEKPIAETSDRGRELIVQQATRPGLVWSVAESFRFWRPALQARELVAAGEIGAPLLCNYPSYVPVKGTPFFESAWRKRPEYDGGFLMDGGVHDIAALRLMFGEVDEVTAVLRSVDAELPPADTLAATITFENGLVASYSASYALDPLRLEKLAAVRAFLRRDVPAIRARYGPKHILGTRGSILIRHNRVELVRGLKRTLFRLPNKGVMVQQLREFKAAIEHSQPLRNTPQEALRDLDVIEALLAAARQHVPVRPCDREPAWHSPQQADVD